MDLRSVSADNMHPSIPPHPHTSTAQETLKDASANLEPETLDLSKKRLRCLSEDLYRENPGIKSMHLEGNTLCSLPENVFLHLPHLVWLDLRNNQITSLPSTIGKHRQLQYLLLEGNPIKMLPIELGDLSTLKALNLRNCPLEFPPEDIVHKGLASILSFLRSFKKEEDGESGVSEFPPVEKLNLKELRSSMDLSGDWSSSEEKKHFEMLKDKIEEKQMEEMIQNELLTCHRKPQNERDRAKGTGWKFFTESRCQRTQRSTAFVLIPRSWMPFPVQLGPAMLVERRKSEADRQAEEKERLAMVLQKQRNEKILKDWQQQTKLMQDHKARSKTKTKNPHEVQVPAPPYATDLDTSQHKNSGDKQKSLAAGKQEMMPRVMSVNSLKETQKERASRDLRLEHRIKQHIQSMQERRRNPARSAQEAMEAARKELQVASLLQAEILQRKREQDAAMEYRFTAFTGDISQQPTGGPQDIFATTLR